MPVNRARALLANYFFFKGLTISDIYELRRALEPELAAELATHLGEEEIDIFSTVLDAEMTERQSSLFAYAVRLLVTVPDATIHSFIELFETDKRGGFVHRAKFQPYIDRLDDDARSFFEHDFLYDYKDTKTQIRARLRGISSQKTIGRMMGNRERKLNLFEELNQGKVVLVDTDEELLKGRASTFLGSLFFGLIHHVSTARVGIRYDQLMPVYVYIDEFADYARNANEKITTILAQARKRKIGIITAFQQFSALAQENQNAVISLSSIRMAGGCERESRLIADSFHTSREFIDGQPKLSFATWVKGVTRSAISFAIEPNTLADFPVMSKEDQGQVRSYQRVTYRTEHQAPREYPRDKEPIDKLEGERKFPKAAEREKDYPEMDPDNPSTDSTDDL